MSKKNCKFKPIIDSNGVIYANAEQLAKKILINPGTLRGKLNKKNANFKYKGITYNYVTDPKILNDVSMNYKPITKSSKVRIISENGSVYPSITACAKNLGLPRTTIGTQLSYRGYFEYCGVKYYLENNPNMTKQVNTYIENDCDEIQESVVQIPVMPIPREDEDEYQEYKRIKDINNQFHVYDFKYEETESGLRYAVALFSDAHIEETVDPENVLGLNEYDIDIAKVRIQKYFQNLAQCLNVDDVNVLYFASLGDTISGFIHEELAQTNQMTPLEATLEAQSLIFSGLKFLCENTKIKDIKFIGIVGNHSRTTKKIQHSNGFKLSYEWLMYKNIESQCKAMKLPIEFCIPNAELAIINTPDNKKFIFCHGFQIKGGGNGTVCGIYPALNRLALKWGKTIAQDKIYLGHFHQCVSIPNAVVNGSIIGYNSFALTNGFSYEEPAQMYEVYDSNIGQLLTRKIYCK